MTLLGRGKICRQGSGFPPTTDKEVMKFKMQKAQIHSRLERMSLRHQTLIALALIYLETWRKFTACCPTQKYSEKGKSIWICDHFHRKSDSPSQKSCTRVFTVLLKSSAVKFKNYIKQSCNHQRFSRTNDNSSRCFLLG